jgi:tetratricopeptide (TPR) repeat protein
VSTRSAARAASLVLLFVPLGLAACRHLPQVPGVPGRDEAITWAEVREQGDDRRRAATHLVGEGLEADDLGDAGRALDRYQLALKLDPGNPWAYLALARHELDQREPSRALASLDRCRSLLEMERNGFLPPRVETHLLGLRGAALEALGRFDEARPLLQEARRRAPRAWADGYLTAGELL